MTTLFNAFNQTATTENGMAALHSSKDPVLDLFYLAGASRGKHIAPQFHAAFAHNPTLTARLLLWLRDVRGGAGERKQFRNLLGEMIRVTPSSDESTIVKFMCLVPEVGRWDDLFAFFDTSYETHALTLIGNALNDEKNALCAKWMPRQGPIAHKIRKHMGLSPKAFRKLLVGLTNVVETKMCAKEWSKIDYSKLPSVASSRYMTAFHRNDPVRYQAYKDALVKGETKINAGAVYPYDIIKGMQNSRGNEAVANAQWLALPDYLEGSKENILPVVDVSGSMTCPAGGNPAVRCIDVSISLGMYLSERSRGIFKDVFMTFSDKPQLFKLRGTLQQRYNQLVKAPWEMSTNLQRAIETILAAGVKHNVPQEEMPTVLLILSDMQFNAAGGAAFGLSAQNMMEKQYAKAGYKMPRIVYWNLNARNTSIPVEQDKSGAALVSGFSPSLMKGILKGGNDPYQTMLDVLMVDRYNFLAE